MADDATIKKTVKIAFMGTKEYRKMLQQEASLRDIKVQALLERAVDAYLSKSHDSRGKSEQKSPIPLYRTGNAELHSKLEAILNSKDRKISDAISASLEAFFEQAKPSARRVSGKS